MRLTIAFDVILSVLTTVLVVALARIPRRYRRLAQSGIPDRAAFLRRVVLTALLHFVFPGLILYLTLEVIAWHVFVQVRQK